MGTPKLWAVLTRIIVVSTSKTPPAVRNGQASTTQTLVNVFSSAKPPFATPLPVSLSCQPLLQKTTLWRLHPWFTTLDPGHLNRWQPGNTSLSHHFMQGHVVLCICVVALKW
ncbi:uncharacterized protein BKA55DRAFT_302835 [Fusarium redolens]|uniref:Secreted protein n=1 Tax=Fusarium redolens TaxID=48865 RepID=A0A9P9KJR7_FUSRE|nr:uncharacterized protein BKA55DRAFT_302835 [Fusarium redolens]KAH7259646.1 hypothetical protein BKA55DRAFT_302835 [Fusarium redolens]